MFQQNNQDPKPPIKLIAIIVVAIVVFIFLIKSSVNINAGEAGVLWKRFDGGVVVDKPALGEGFHVIAPWNKVVVYDVRQQEISETMKVLSSNGLDITLDATVWYMPDIQGLGRLHQKIGEQYLTIVLKPALRSASRNVLGRYIPEQIYATKREQIKDEIYEETVKILADQNVIVKDVLIRDVTLPLKIKEAIERKLEQEQESLEYKFRLEKASKEAQKQEIEAKGKALANKILSASLTDKILREKGIQATLELSKSPNSKLVIVGSAKNGMPLILNN